MKTKTLFCAALLQLFATVTIISCNKLGYGTPSGGHPSSNGQNQNGKTSSFRVHFVRNLPSVYGPGPLSAIPDTNDFILRVTDSKGAKLYEGKFGAAPASFNAPAGTYTVRAVSCEFSAPVFETPQFGDEQAVTVAEGQDICVRLACKQLNAGFRLNVDYSFRVSYPDAVLYVFSAQGRLMYTYNENRYGFFQPGSVTLQLESAGGTERLFTRVLQAQEMLTLNLSAAGGPAEPSDYQGISMALDTSRIWNEESYCYGSDMGGDVSSALSIDEAKARVGEKGVWVYGYIVGGDLTSASCSFETPFTSRTNIAIASKSSCEEKDACIAVQLSKGDIRDAINLVDHPELLGKQIFLKGNIVDAYFGITGLQSLTEYSLRQ